MDNTFKELREYTENAEINALGYTHLFTVATERIFPKWTYKIEKIYGTDKLIKGYLYRCTERDINPVPLVLFEWINDDNVNVKILQPLNQNDMFKIVSVYSFTQDTLMTYDLYELMFGIDADMIHSVVESMLHPLKIS